MENKNNTAVGIIRALGVSAALVIAVTAGAVVVCGPTILPWNSPNKLCAEAMKHGYQVDVNAEK